LTRRNALWRLLALLCALSFIAAACGGDDDDSSKASGGTSTTAKAAKGGELEGMKGTTPLVELSDTFKTNLKAVDPKLKDFNYAAESYDAVVIIALATDAAKSDGIEMAAKINGVTRGGTKCKTYAECKALLDKDAATDIDYDGQSGPLEFSGNGEPTVASYGILQFGADNHIDDAKTEYRSAQAPASADVPQQDPQGTRKGDGTLKIGTILPETGSLAFLGPPEFAGVDLAVKDINAAGGALGKPIELSKGDSGDTSTDIANQTVDRLLTENVDAIIGAASSGVSKTVVDKITAAGVVEFSPANTAKDFSTYPDKGLYFRDAPSDILQGAVLGEVIAEDGRQSVGILALDDPYGTGLADDLSAALKDAGVDVVEKIIYDPQAQTFDAEVGKIKAKDPDGIVIIGFDESSRILATMVEQGIGPKDKAVYGVDGNMGNALGDNFDAGK